MCNECKIGRAMARRKASRSVTITTEDILYGVLGAGVGLAANGVINRALASQPEGTRQTIGQVLPILKVAAGGSVAMNKKMDRKVRFAALGAAFAGGIEAGVKFAPQYFSISGGSADIFSLIQGTSVTEIPVNPNSALQPGSDPMFEESPILGSNGVGNMLVL